MRWMRVVAILGALAAAGSALADGAFMRQRSQEAKPTIPYQRAFISWRDGRETMIVESVLNAPKGDYEWVVPLPSPQVKIEACLPGALEAVSMQCRPNVRTFSLSGWWPVAAFTTCLCVAAFWIGTSRGLTPWDRRGMFLAVFLIGLIAMAVTFPVFACAKVGPGGAGDDAEVPAKGTADAYAYEIVRPPDAEFLARKLDRDGFRLPAEARDAVRGYISNRWSFALMKVRQGPAAAVSPHPMRFEFPAKEPVYPMALTGATTDRLRLDLFVVGSGVAAVPGMDVWRVMKVVPKPDRSGSPTPPGKTVSEWSPISHPDVAPYLWDGATLTYLRGDLSGRELRDDLRIGFSRQVPAFFEKDVSSLRIAAQDAFCTGCAAASVAVFLLGFLAVGAACTTRRILSSVAAGLCLGVVFGCVGFFRTPRVEVGPKRDGLESIRRFKALEIELLTEKWDHGNFPESWIAEVRRQAPGDVPNLDVPGGYTLKRDARGFQVTLYDELAAPHGYRMDPAGHIDPEASSPR